MIIVEERLNNFKIYMDSLVENSVFPGAVYAIISKDFVYKNSVGNRSVFPWVVKNNVTTKYDIAAVSFVVSTIPMLSILIDKGELSLYDKVTIFFPEFIHKEITIFNLVTHTSGYPADIDTSNISDDIELLKVICNLKLSVPTGTSILYSEINMLILGRIVESIYMKTLDVVTSQLFFKKIGMKNTGYNPVFTNDCAPTEFDEKYGLIVARVHDEKARLLKGVAGHDGIFTNIDDMILYSKMVLNDGDGIISMNMIDKWFSPLVDDVHYDNKVPSPTINGGARSFGFIYGKNYYTTGNLCSENVISIPGFTGSSIIIDRDYGFAFILLTNRVHLGRDNKKIFDFRPKIIEEVYKIMKLVL